MLDVLKPYESDKLSGNTFIKTPTFDEDYKVGQALKHLALVSFPASAAAIFLEKKLQIFNF